MQDNIETLEVKRADDSQIIHPLTQSASAWPSIYKFAVPTLDWKLVIPKKLPKKKTNMHIF